MSSFYRSTTWNAENIETWASKYTKNATAANANVEYVEYTKSADTNAIWKYYAT